MDFQRLFLSAEGRIGRGEFWAGWCILFVVNMVLHFLPVIGSLIGLLLIYPWVCVYSKRLHDMGRSGWLQIIPTAIFFIAVAFMIATSLSAIIQAGGAANSSTSAFVAAMGGSILIFCLWLLVALGFLLWVGISAGQPGPNRFGADPDGMVDMVSPATFD
jgi:uncharacterized membrane protein YhaH (DUF805 family)